MFETKIVLDEDYTKSKQIVKRSNKGIHTVTIPSKLFKEWGSPKEVLLTKGLFHNLDCAIILPKCSDTTKRRSR